MVCDYLNPILSYKVYYFYQHGGIARFRMTGLLCLVATGGMSWICGVVSSTYRVCTDLRCRRFVSNLGYVVLVAESCAQHLTSRHFLVKWCSKVPYICPCCQMLSSSTVDRNRRLVVLTLRSSNYRVVTLYRSWNISHHVDRSTRWPTGRALRLNLNGPPLVLLKKVFKLLIKLWILTASNSFDRK